MVRRTAPRAESERNARPVVVRVLVPELGLGRTYKAVYQWLGENLGKGEFWHGPHTCALGEGMAFHFRTVEHASAFLAHFPELVLADGTMARSYSSPDLPFGREEVSEMCNLYNQTTAQEARRQLFQGIAFHDRAGNLPEQPEIYPDYLAPIIRNAPASVPCRQKNGSGRHERAQRRVGPLAQMAWARVPMPCAGEPLCRTRHVERRQHLVRSAGQPACVLRRDTGSGLEVYAEAEGR